VKGLDWTCTYPHVHGFDSYGRQKTPIVKGVGEDRKVAVPGSPKAQAVTLSSLFNYNGFQLVQS
jgi:hypothetical protein